MYPVGMDSDPIDYWLGMARDQEENGKVYGFSRFYHIIEKTYEWKKCELLEYQKAPQQFLIKWPGSEITKKVTRSNFYFDCEDEEEFFWMLEQAKKWRSMAAIYVQYNNMIDRIDTETNQLDDKVKDNVIYLALGVPYKIFQPRDPFAQNNLPLKNRYNSAYILEQPKQFDFPPNFDYVKCFKKKGYNLQKLNHVTKEIEDEFVRANHQIEFDNSLPFSNERQALFKGLLNDQLFVPLQNRVIEKSDKMGFISQETDTDTFLGLLTWLKKKNHRADDNKNRILMLLNQLLLEIDTFHFVMTCYPKIFTPKDF